MTARQERELVFPIARGNDISNDADLTAWLLLRLSEQCRATGQTVSDFKVADAALEDDEKTGLCSVRANASFRLSHAATATNAPEAAVGGGRTLVSSQADVEGLVPMLVSELVILATIVLQGSIFEPLTPLVAEMISTFIPRHAVAFYCGADSGKRPGKIIVLSIFKAIEEFFGEMEAAVKSKGDADDILKAMLDNRGKNGQRDAVSSDVVIARLLAWANIPLSAATASSAVTLWFCNPEKMALAFDRLLQFPKRNIEPTTLEATDEIGGAAFGDIDTETRWDEFGSAIAAAIHSVLKAGSIAAPIRFLERIVLYLGAQRLIGTALDKSLDPTIDIHIMNANLLQKLFAGPQSPGMPEGVASVDYFYSHVLGKLIEEHVPHPMRGYARKAVETVASVVSRSDMLKDLVFGFVLPNLLKALEQL